MKHDTVIWKLENDLVSLDTARWRLSTYGIDFDSGKLSEIMRELKEAIDYLHKDQD